MDTVVCDFWLGDGCSVDLGRGPVVESSLVSLPVTELTFQRSPERLDRIVVETIATRAVGTLEFPVGQPICNSRRAN